MNKSLRVERDDKHGYLFHIVWNGGGQMPEELKGHYTSPAVAQTAIDVWAAKQGREVEVEVKKVEEPAPAKPKNVSAI